MKTHLKFLFRNKFFTVIQTVGLAVALAFVIIIGNHIRQQYSVARENPDYKNTYIIGSENDFFLSYGYCDLLAERFPEITEATRVDWGYCEAEMEDNKRKVSVLGAEPEFFKFFPYYELIEGSAETLREKNSVIISRSFAAENGLRTGDRFIMNGESASVGAIFGDFRNTLFAPVDVLVGYGHSVLKYYEMFPFNFFGSVSFVKLLPETDFADLERKLNALSEEVYNDYTERGHALKIILFRQDRAFFEIGKTAAANRFRTGDLNSLRMLLFVGLFLLLSALFNYINLSFALNGKRAKEMATRRLLGSARSAVIWRCIAESLLHTAFCFCLGLLLAIALTPMMNSLLNDPDIPIRIAFSPASVTLYLLLILAVGILAGLLPALLASSYEPVDVIKGSFRTSSKMTFSKIFIVCQNAIAVFLLAMSFVMEAQHRHSLNRPLNLDIADKYYIDGHINLRLSSFNDEVASIPGISRVGYGSGVPGLSRNGLYLQSRSGDELSVSEFTMDSMMVAMLGIRPVLDFGVPPGNAVWFSEKTFLALGMDENDHDIGPTRLSERWLDWIQPQTAGTYIGMPVVPSNIGTDADEYQMLYFGKSDSPDFVAGGALLEVTGDRRETEKLILEAFGRSHMQVVGFEPNPNEHFWLDERFREALRPARNNMRLLEIFMLLSIFVSLLGMLAMSTYYAGVRIKDIAVRKVFGGSVASETIGSVRDYMILVGIACVIGIPAAIWAAGRYLESYIYRISNYGWLFAAAVLLAVILAFLSVLWQTLRAARTDPAAELKKE